MFISPQNSIKNLYPAGIVRIQLYTGAFVFYIAKKFIWFLLSYAGKFVCCLYSVDAIKSAKKAYLEIIASEF